MAKETFVQLTDDLDGSEAAEELTFGFRGVEYEIDLNAKNVAALEKALDKYVNAGSKVKASRTPRNTKLRQSGSAGRADTSPIREWARSNGYTLSDRGRIPAEIREAYEAAAG